jgi:hypothetical protein
MRTTREEIRLMPEAERAERALREAVTELIAEARREGLSLPTLRDGKVVWVPAAEYGPPELEMPDPPTPPLRYGQ